MGRVKNSESGPRSEAVPLLSFFELDTGGVGFYAAYSGSSAWWGTNYSTNGFAASNTYGSGITYSGNQVISSITLYTDSTPTSAVVTSSQNIVIGQSTNIVGGSATWPASTNPPVDGFFYGDFGLNLSTNPDNVLNPLAQFSYTNGILPGYIITLGAYGATNGASIQIGLSAADVTDFAKNGSVFAMTATNTNSFFPNNPTIPTQSTGQALTGTLLIGSNSFTNVGINLDTGTPTPKIHSDAIPANLISSNGTNLLSGLALDLTVTNTNGISSSILSIPATGTTYGSNQVAVESSMGNYITAGLLPFYGHSVMYNLSDSTLGIVQAVPEPATIWLLVLAGIGLIVAFRRKSKNIR